ncbi:MAG: hypothetical protein LC135_16205 [Phycisphaerae bacterium]|nr:hypothetical protein [Phycisphaerae bacterium]MCZ2401383.1 hypothetical protein [Phycisphaerae bacterium]
MTRRGEIEASWRERLAARGLHRVEQLLDWAGDEPRLPGAWTALRKPGLGGRQRWRWELTDGRGAPPVLFMKRYERTPLRTQLDRIRRQDGGHSRGWWEYCMARELERAQIPTAAPVGYAEEMYGRLERRSVVLLAGVPGEPFDRAWRRLASEGSALTRGPARHDVTVRLARFAAAFHSTGLCHRDLYLCHVFADFDAEALRAPRFHLIDLARVHRPRVRRMRWLIKDLAQLDSSARQVGASRTDRLRFLLAYLGLQRVSHRTRWYARRIVRKSDHILERHSRKSREARALPG